MNNKQIMYDCDKGYILSEKGPVGATCVGGLWRPTVLPQCIPGLHPRLRWSRRKREIRLNTRNIPHARNFRQFKDAIKKEILNEIGNRKSSIHGFKSPSNFDFKGKYRRQSHDGEAVNLSPTHNEEKASSLLTEEPYKIPSKNPFDEMNAFDFIPIPLSNINDDHNKYVKKGVDRYYTKSFKSFPQQNMSRRVKRSTYQTDRKRSLQNDDDNREADQETPKRTRTKDPCEV